jgi:hypothetical protein
MRTLKKETKIIQTLQPNKTCTCGACTPPKPKLPVGMRRIKIQPKFVQHTYSNTTVPLIMLTGAWLHKIGFESKGYVVVYEKEGELLIRVDKTQ